MIGDELYYVRDASYILNGQPIRILTRPPLGKLFIAGGISLFGNNAVGWRIFPIIFGTASIFIFYLICVQLVKSWQVKTNIASGNGSKWFQPSVFIPVLATFLFAFENLSFVMAHAAMLEVFYVTFMLLGFLFYLKKRYILCGIAMGLSLLSKETAVFGIIVIIVHWAISSRREILEDINYTWRTISQRKEPDFQDSPILNISLVLVIVVAMWVFILPMLEWTKTPLWGMPFSRTWYIFWINLSMAGTQGSGFLATIRTWTLLLQEQLANFNPVAAAPHYYTAISFSLWILLIPTIIYLTWQTFRDLKQKLQNSVVLFTFSWFMVIFGIFLLVDLLLKRPMFAFYFYPCVPPICIGIALGAWKLYDITSTHKYLNKFFVPILVLLIIATLVSFVLMTPLGGKLIT
jgi:predicted membrane-bound dolichyl-phosphate-mannose-protein mannosyltransferase